MQTVLFAEVPWVSTSAQAQHSVSIAIFDRPSRIFAPLPTMASFDGKGLNGENGRRAQRTATNPQQKSPSPTMAVNERPLRV